MSLFSGFKSSRHVAGQLAAINRSQAVIEFDLDGKVVDANENFLDVMGYSLAEVKGQHHSLFMPPEERDAPTYKQFWDDLRRGEFARGQYLRVGKGGREVWILASYNPVFDQNGNPFKVVKFATDITASKLRNADLAGQIADVVGAGIHPGAAGGPGDDGELRVQQLPAGIADHPRPEIAQLTECGGVERQRLHRADPRGRLRGGVERAQPGAHLPRRPLGERDGQHLSGRDVTAGNQLGDPVRDGAGLPRSGTDQHADRAAGSQHGLALLVVQPGCQWIGDRRHGVHLGSGRRQTRRIATP